MTRRKVMGKKQKKTIPTAVELKILIAPIFPKPLDDGNWQFICSFPEQGYPDVQIIAKTADRAKEILEEVIYNELDGRENLEDLQ